MLQAAKFTDKRAPGLHLDLDEDLQAAGCFTEVIRGYQMEVVEPDVMHGLQPAGATRVTLDVIIPSPTGLTPGKVEADRDAVSAGLAFQLQPPAALACDKGLTPICGPTKEANEPPSYVLSLEGQLRQVYEQSPLPAAGSLFAYSYAATTCAESGLP